MVITFVAHLWPFNNKFSRPDNVFFYNTRWKCVCAHALSIPIYQGNHQDSALNNLLLVLLLIGAGPVTWLNYRCLRFNDDDQWQTYYMRWHKADRIYHILHQISCDDNTIALTVQADSQLDTSVWVLSSLGFWCHSSLHPGKVQYLPTCKWSH